MPRHTIAASTIIGTHVENWEGEHLGVISEVMIDKHQGTLCYLVLSYPGEYGRLWPNKRFAVPFESIAMKVGEAAVEYILDVDEAFLRKAPGFDTDDWPDFADEAFNTNIRDYYKDVSVNMVA